MAKVNYTIEVLDVYFGSSKIYEIDYKLNNKVYNSELMHFNSLYKNSKKIFSEEIVERAFYAFSRNIENSEKYRNSLYIK